VDKSDFLISENENLAKAMRAIGANCRGIIFLKNSSNVVKASLTDGDIRRHLLKFGDLSDVVSRAANYNFIYVKESETTKAKDIMQKSQINCLPVLDKNGKLISVVSQSEFLGLKSSYLKSKTAVVIMAGGKGSRLKTYSNILPKPLIPIGNYTITERIIENFKTFGYGNFHMIINYKKNLIKAYFSELGDDYKISFIEENTPLKTGGGLKLIESGLNETFFMTNCDIIVDENYLEIYKFHKKKKNIITLVCAEKFVTLPYGVIKLDKSGNVKDIEEKPNLSFITNTGFYVVEPEFLDFIPKNKPIDITDIIGKCINNKEKVGIYKVPEDSWHDMGQPEKLQEMIKFFCKSDVGR
jgi:dTDP-glucose pyrophosphorylase